MKPKQIFSLGTIAGILLAVSLIVSNVSCAGKGIDVVNHQSPVSGLYSRIGGDLHVMATLPPAQRAAYMREHWPHLEQGVVAFLRQRGKIRRDQNVQRVEFRFGSLQNVRAEGGDGQIRNGYFNNQLVAVAYIRGVENPISVIVQCLNGMFALPNDTSGLQALGSFEPREQFTIGRGEGLIHHVDFPLAVDLAERFNLPLYRGKRMNDRQQITPAQARGLESRTDWIQITVFVVEGDSFDLRQMTFTPSSRRPRS